MLGLQSVLMTLHGWSTISVEQVRQIGLVTWNTICSVGLMAALSSEMASCGEGRA